MEEVEWSWDIAIKVLNHSCDCDGCGMKTSSPVDVASCMLLCHECAEELHSQLGIINDEARLTH